MQSLMSLSNTGNRCSNNGLFPVKLLNILSAFLFLVISIRKWIELYYLINWWSNFKMWLNSWPAAAAAENNLNSTDQTEAGFQRTFKTSPDCCSRINPYHPGRRGLSGALLRRDPFRLVKVNVHERREMRTRMGLSQCSALHTTRI